MYQEEYRDMYQFINVNVYEREDSIKEIRNMLVDALSEADIYCGVNLGSYNYNKYYYFYLVEYYMKNGDYIKRWYRIPVNEDNNLHVPPLYTKVRELEESQHKWFRVTMMDRKYLDSIELKYFYNNDTYKVELNQEDYDMILEKVNPIETYDQNVFKYSIDYNFVYGDYEFSDMVYKSLSLSDTFTEIPELRKYIDEDIIKEILDQEENNN